MAHVKTIWVVFCLLIAVGSGRAADSAVEEKIKAIRAKYARIERGLKDCRQVKRDLPGESAEGGELRAWYKDRSVEKLSATFFGEMGKAEEEYYFWNSELLFVLRVESRYTKPMSGVTKSKTEDRYYFDAGRLIRWINAGKKQEPLNAEAEKRGRELQESGAKFKALARD